MVICHLFIPGIILPIGILFIVFIISLIWSNCFIKALTSEMQEEYGIVLIDTPPILPVTDAVAFSSRVDGTILGYQVGRIGRNHGDPSLYRRP